jgi:hypothetical protein
MESHLDQLVQQIRQIAHSERRSPATDDEQVRKPPKKVETASYLDLLIQDIHQAIEPDDSAE